MKPIEKKVVINASVGEVWKALTDPAKIEQWMLMPNNFKPQLNHDFAFNAEMDGNKFDIKCRVLELEEHKKLSYSWTAPIFQGNTTVSISLKNNNGATELTLIHSGFDEKEKDAMESHSKGWELRFVEKLKEAVEKY